MRCLSCGRCACRLDKWARNPAGTARRMQWCGVRGYRGMRRVASKGGSMRLVLSLAAGASLTLGLVSVSLGHQGTKPPPPPKTIPCDVCNNKMNLTDHKTKTNTQEVK